VRRSLRSAAFVAYAPFADQDLLSIGECRQLRHLRVLQSHPQV
jgi:hypothetical protein